MAREPIDVLGSLRLLLVAAIAGGAVMVLEIAAPRLVAPGLGTGALTWTVTIATFLGGLALGHAGGGRLADRRGRALLPGLLALSAVLTVLTPPLYDLVAAGTDALGHDVRVLLVLPLAFLPVSILLGTLPPVVARALLHRGRGAGLRLGLVAALGAAGSVLGTFLAGFTLIPALGLRGVFLWVAGGLLLAALLAPWRGTADVELLVPRRVAPALPRRLWIALAATAGAALLTLEIVAGRFASDRLGASIYTWTSVIGVVLTGLAFGQLLGGRLADRFATAPRALLGRLLLIASMASAAVLWAPAILDLANVWAEAGTLSWPRAILAACALAFLAPSIAIGTLSPVVIRAALSEPDTDGRIVGGLYAAGALGAVAGAGLVGYFLIPWAGLERLVLFLAFGLALASATVRGRPPYAWYAVILLLALGVQGPWPEARGLAQDLGLVERAPNLLLEDSRHARIRVQPIEERQVALAKGLGTIQVAMEPTFRGQGMYDGEAGLLHWRGPMTEEQHRRLGEMVPAGPGQVAVDRLLALTKHDRRQLRLDRLVHGYVDLDDPSWLGYGYERLYATVLEHLWPDKVLVSCLFIGGGAYAFQQHLLVRHGEGIRCVSAEIDPQVTIVARDWLGLADDDRHLIVHEDARTWVARLVAGEPTYDVVFGDAFDHIAVPFHLTTVEFARDLERHMAPDGIYLVNVVDSWASGRFLGAFVNTLEQVFAHVRVVSASPRRTQRRDTYVVVASNAPLVNLPDELPAGPQGDAAVVVDPAEVRALAEKAGRRVLTDDDAPVETLLAPVLRTR